MCFNDTDIWGDETMIEKKNCCKVVHFFKCIDLYIITPTYRSVHVFYKLTAIIVGVIDRSTAIHLPYNKNAKYVKYHGN